MKMKTLIMTSNASFLDNYGAVLQAYAMSKQLGRWGYEPEIVNYKYNTGNQTVSVENQVDRSVRARIKYIFSGDISFTQKILYRLAREKRNVQTDLFREFVKNNIPIDLDMPVTYEELKRNKSDYGCLICGSDQVWNPLIHANQNDPGFFYNLATVNVRGLHMHLVLEFLHCQTSQS